MAYLILLSICSLKVRPASNITHLSFSEREVTLPLNKKHSPPSCLTLLSAYNYASPLSINLVFMLYVLPDSAGDMLMLQGTGTLSQDDYTDVFLTQIEKQLKPGHTLRVLLYLDQDFQDFTADSNWNAQQLFKASNTNIARMAIISDGSGLELCQSFATEDVQHFAIAGFLTALHWCDEAL